MRIVALRHIGAPLRFGVALSLAAFRVILIILVIIGDRAPQSCCAGRSNTRGKMTEEDLRTNDLGLFNFAHSYWLSATVLQNAKCDCTHPDAPAAYLFYHAIELYLKSFLRMKGWEVKQVRALNHSILKVSQTAADAGLTIAAEHNATLKTIPPNYMAARYIKTGFYARSSLNDLWKLCRDLHLAIEPQINRKNGLSRLRSLPPTPR